MSKQACNYCNKDNGALISGITQGSYICMNCVKEIVNLISDTEIEVKEEKDTEDVSLIKPSEIKARLDEYVIGQEVAKKKLAIAVYNHYKRMRKLEKDPTVEIDKSNVMMVGPTGSGKTFFLRTLAKFLGVPLAITDATNLTQAG